MSDPESLAKHLGELGEGEIKITRIEPETTVAWEGDRASGTVQIEPSGWGTKVTLTATVPEVEPPPPPPEPEPVDVAAEPEPVAVEPELVPDEPVAAPTASDLLERAGFFSRVFGRPRRAEIADPPPPPEPEIQPPAPVPEPEPEEEPPMPEPTPLPERDPDPMPPAAVEKFLSDVLDSLGAAHHRPFSRQ